MLGYVTFDDGFFYLWAKVIERDKRTQVSLRDFMLQAELSVGDSGGVCQLIFQNTGSGQQFHEVSSREIIVGFDDVGSAAGSRVDF
jgi:hypothetical protein